ncbi:MAG: glycosyltransferase family 2 protein [Chloroflexi bacterium]|nr:glycosyltransferase family 2 protein [Chloroflexota bacterium]
MPPSPFSSKITPSFTVHHPLFTIPLLSAVVLTLNEEKHLADCLASLRWADEIVVFDSFSADRTADITRSFEARFIQHRFANYASQRNAALEAAAGDWVLFVDADERVTAELADEARLVVQKPGPVGWWVPRHNYIFGKLTLHAGWYPDYQLRLLKRAHARYDPARHVHELVRLDGAEGFLQSPLVHLNYETVPEFIVKQHAYTKYDAGILYAQGRRARPHNFALQPLRQFYWRFVTLGGWRDGWHGLRLSALMAYFQFVLYRNLQLLQDRKSLF